MVKVIAIHAQVLRCVTKDQIMQHPKVFLFASITLAILTGLMLGSSASLAQEGTDKGLQQQANAELVSRTLLQAQQSSELAKQESPALSKIGGFLRPLMQRKKAAAPQRLNPMVNTKGDSRVQIYITLGDVSEQHLDDLNAENMTIEVINQELKKVQGWADIAALESLATLQNIIRITVPSYGTPAAGRVTTQGDAILRASELRALGASGRGVKVGIVSDGANSWRSAASTGDLPRTITTYGSCTTRADDPQNCRSRLTCNEGTAMAEIIHDIAPDAKIAVSAVSTSLEFIQQIKLLANTFKADIIVDDLGFFGEPYFEDGDLARAVSALPSNILYFSSAGNSANTHYEQQYSALGSRHNFGAQRNVNDDAIGFGIRPKRGVFVLMQWADRYQNANSNYDLFVFDQDNEVARSTGVNRTAIEGVCVYNGSNSNAVRFALINKVSGSNRRLEMFFLGASGIEYPTPAGSVFGHAGTRRAIAVGAINAGSSQAAFYSSQGPARINFPSIQLRAKPDIAATDGVTVTGAGGFSSPFFGTSAAAPHAAAVAAQLLSAGPDVTPSDVRTALLAAASGGGSRISVGSGRIDALGSFQRLGIELNSSGRIPGLQNNAPAIVAPLFLLLNNQD
ncbi:MAG: subtilisin family serine protease [Arenicella sp.]|jgi:subtilisin family serine protease